MLYLGQVVEDSEAALGDGDVHSVFGADVDGSARFGQNDEAVSVDRTLVMDRVVLYLQGEEQQQCWLSP